MVYKIADLILCWFGAYLFTEAIDVAEGSLISYKKRLSFIVLFGSINFALRQSFLDFQELRILITYFMLLCASRAFYGRSSYKKIFQIATMYAFSAFVSSFILLGLSQLVEIPIERIRGTLQFLIIYNGNIIIIMILFISILKYFYQKRYFSYDRPIYSWSKYIFIGFLALLINVHIVMYYYIGGRYVADRFLLVVPVTIISFIIFFIYTQLLMGSQNQQNKQMMYYINNLKLMSEEITEFKHDINNVYIGLYGLAKSNQLDRLKESVLEIFDSRVLEQTISTESLININDRALIQLVAEKMYQASKAGIHFNIEIPYKVTDIPINRIDILRVIGILLDNAIEAAKNSEGQEVYFIIINTKTIFDVTIINSYDSAVNVSKVDEKGYTTKLDGKGLGLSNVGLIFEKYEGIEWNTFIDEASFIQNITISKVQNQ